MDAKAKLGAKDALARSANRVIACKGRTVVTVEMNESVDDEKLLAVMLGPTGNLRAPTLVRGKTVIVGFNEDAYNQILAS